MVQWESLAELKSKIDQHRPLSPELMGTLDQKFKIEWTYNSNAIEGNSMTLQETSFFLQEGLTSKGKTLKDYLEAQNHVEAIDWLKEILRDEREISESLIKEMNALLLKGIDTVWIEPSDRQSQKRIYPGKYKTEPNHVITMDGDVHEYCDPLRVPEEMEKLVTQINKNPDQYHPVELAARSHHYFVATPPFDDGNGRVGRLIMNLIVLKAGYPPIVIKNETKEDYYRALMKADKNDLSDLLNLCHDEMRNSLELMVRVISKGKTD